MRMSPLFTETGQLLGHVDLDWCVNAGQYIIVDNAPHIQTFVNTPIDVTSTVERIKLPMRKILFRDAEVKSTVVYIIADTKLPKWFWDVPGMVEFHPAQWRDV